MRCLLDTNVFLEVALSQGRALEAGRLLQSGVRDLYISDLSLHSIGIRLFRQGLFEAHSRLMDDVFISEAVQVLSLPLEAHAKIQETARAYSLDFEDAYQFEVANHFGLALVSFDTDFDRSRLKRLTPSEVLAFLK